MDQLKQKFDDFIRLPSFSSRDFIDILNFMRLHRFTDPPFVNHEIYFKFNIMLKNLLNKCLTGKSFTQFECSCLFPCLTEFFCLTNYSPTDLIEPLQQCLNKHIDDENISNLLRNYRQNEQIMNVIVNCLCSKDFFQTKFLFSKCSRYFQAYQGLHKNEMTEKLLKHLSEQLLSNYSKKSTDELLNLLDHCFQFCSNDNLRISFLLSMSKNPTLLQNVQQKENISSMFTSNIGANKEEITLILYDENLDTHDKAQKSIERFQQVNNYILICPNINIIVEYIIRVEKEKVFLILSKQITDEIMKQIHDLKQVHSIYMFCKNTTKNHHHKIVGEYFEYEPLLEAISENIKHLLKQSQLTNLFRQYGRSIRNLNNESKTFVEFYAFKYMLLKLDFDREQAKNDMIQACRNYYSKENTAMLAQIDRFEQNYDRNNALRWYAEAGFIFRLVNKALRTENYDDLLALRLFITDLYKEIQLKYEDLKHEQQIVVYRGAKCTRDDIYTLQHNTGKIIATNGFLSTSRSNLIAEIFSGQERKESDCETILLEIHADLTQLTTVFADISQYSPFEDEEEILFAFGATFIIENVTYNKSIQVWNVKLSALPEENFIDNMKILFESFRYTETNFAFAELLIKMGLSIQCQKYLTNLKHENSAAIKELLAWSFEKEQNFDRAIAHYEQAFELFSSSNHWEDAVRVTILIALCYIQKQEFTLAQQFVTKAENLLKNQIDLPDNHCQFGSIMICRATIENNDFIAQNYYRQALEIFQNPSPTCQCQSHEKKLAKIYEIIGLRYRAEKNYEQSIEYLLKSEELLKKSNILQEDRDVYANSLIALMDCFMKKHDEVTAQIYGLKFLKFIDTDIMNLIYGNNLDAKDGVLMVKTMTNDFETQLLYESRLLTTSKDNKQIIERHLNIGEIYTKIKQFEWAREHYEKAKELCQKTKSSDIEWAQCLFDIGHRSALGEDIEYSREHVIDALGLRLSLLDENDIDIGFSYYDLCLLCDNSKEYDRGIDYCQIAIKIFEIYLNDDEIHQFHVKRQYALNFHLIALMHHKKQEFNQSNSYLNTAINYLENFLFQIPESHCLLAKCYSLMANNYFLLSNIETSITYHTKVLDVFDKHPHVNLFLIPHDHTKEISDTFLVLGRLYYAKLNYEQSTFYYEQFINSPSADQQNLPNSYGMLGQNYMNRKCYDRAIEYFEKAVGYYESQLPNEFDLYAECIGNMTLCYLKMGKNQIEHATECILKVIEICEQDKNYYNAKSAYYYLIYSLTFFVRADYTTSMNILNQTSILAVENKPILAQVQFVISHCFYEIKDYQAAIKYAQMSMETFKQQCSDFNNEHNVKIHNLIARSFFRLNNFKQALSTALICHQIIAKIHSISTLNIALAHSISAMIYSKQCNNRNADKHCKTALNICEQLIAKNDDIESIGEVFEDIGELFLNQNNVERARIYYDEALKFYQQELVDNHPRIQHIQSTIDKMPEICQQTVNTNSTHSMNYISEKFANFYRTFFRST